MEFNSSFYFSIFIFLLTYAGIMSERIPRSLCALLGAGLVVYSGLVTQEMALRHFIDFNTIGLLAGMMILIGVVKKSGFFEAMALWSVKISKGRPKELLIILGLITGFCASFMDAVTAVLLITPMTISLCRRIHVTPIPTLIAEILLSNIGGSGTMVGDPPNVMIGSATHLVFNDFAMNTGPIALLNVAACIIYLEIIYGKELPKTEMTAEELGKINISSVITDYSILKNPSPFWRSLFSALSFTILLASNRQRSPLQAACLPFLPATWIPTKYSVTWTGILSSSLSVSSSS